MLACFAFVLLFSRNKCLHSSANKVFALSLNTSYLECVNAIFPAYNLSYLHMQGSNGKNHFVFVTNLSPCSGVRLHLWPEKGTEVSTLPINKRVLEVTSKMVQIPSGPAPRQVLSRVHCLSNVLK